MPLLLQKEIYESNHYYYFDAMKIDKMRGVIEGIDYDIPSTEQVSHIKNQFEKIKKDTLISIYETASRNIQILERMANFDLKMCQKINEQLSPPVANKENPPS